MIKQIFNKKLNNESQLIIQCTQKIYSYLSLLTFKPALNNFKNYKASMLHDYPNDGSAPSNKSPRKSLNLPLHLLKDFVAFFSELLKI